MRLGFAGTPEFAVPALEALAARHSVAAVFTQPDRPSGRGQPLHASPVKQRAVALGLAVHQPASFKSPDSVDLVRSLQLDALVVVAYGQILSAATLALPRLGCINIHASLLPRWRGAAPIQRALLAGDDQTGVTIMRMEAGLDTGPMYTSRAFEIGSRDNAKTLHDRLAALGAELVVQTLESLAAGRAAAVPQPAAGITYAEKIRKTEARIQWAQSAVQILRQVRAFNPWPVAETRLNGEQLRIWEAETLNSGTITGVATPGKVLAASDDGIDVACGENMLRLQRVQLAGRKAMSAGEFLKGQRLDGARFEA